MASTMTVTKQEQCPACEGTGAWQREARVSPCEQGLCVYLASKNTVALNELAQWIAEVGGQSIGYAYGYLVNTAAKGLLEVEPVEGLQLGQHPVRLTKLGCHVAAAAQQSPETARHGRESVH